MATSVPCCGHVGDAAETASTLSARPAASAFTRLLFLVTALFIIAGISGDGVADVDPRELPLFIPPPPLLPPQPLAECVDSTSFSVSLLRLQGTENTPLATAEVLLSDRVLGRDRNPPSSSSFSDVNTSPLLQRE